METDDGRQDRNLHMYLQIVFSRHFVDGRCVHLLWTQYVHALTYMITARSTHHINTYEIGMYIQLLSNPDLFLDV